MLKYLGQFWTDVLAEIYEDRWLTSASRCM